MPAPVRTLLGPLVRSLFKPLWGESRELRARRRCKLAVGLPFAGLGGFVWGFFSAPILGLPERLPWALFGAAAFGLFLYVQNRLEPPIREASRRLSLGPAGAVLWDAGVVGGLTFLLTDVLGAPTVSAVATALLAGAAYAWGLDYVLCGSGARHVGELLIPVRGGSVPYKDQHSLAAALAARGEVDGAIKTYAEAVAADPTDLVPYVRMARLMSGEADRHHDAVRVLRAAMRDARLDERQEAFVVRQIEEIWSTRVGDARRAAPDLARFLERHPDSEHGAWARETLGRIKSEIEAERDRARRDRPPGEDPPSG